MTNQQARDLTRRMASFLSRVHLGGPLRLAAFILETARSNGFSLDLDLQIRVPDSNGKEREPVTVRQLFALDRLLHVPDESFDRSAEEFLWSAVWQIYMHEAAEWFRVDGVKVRDPHRGTDDRG